jgi:hypothetical protein
MIHNVAKLLDNKILNFAEVIKKLSTEKDLLLEQVTANFGTIENRL